MNNMRAFLGFIRTRGLYLAAILVMVSSVHTGLRLGGRGGAVFEAQAELARQEAKKQELEAISSGLDSMEFVEQQARDKLGLAKLGETVVILPPEGELRKLAPREDEADESFELEKRPIWRQWLNLFGLP